MKSLALLLLAFVGSVLCQPPWGGHNASKNLYPIINDGFETVILDDVSFATELHYETFPSAIFNPGAPVSQQTNLSFFVFGTAGANSNTRTVYPQDHSFYVADFPSFPVPFVDVHSFQNGSDVWFLGSAVAVLPGAFKNTTGYATEIVIHNTNWLATGRHHQTFVTPLAFQGTYFSISVVQLDLLFILTRPGQPVPPTNMAIAYFVGFFTGTDGTLIFGINRGFFNLTDIYSNVTISNTLSFDPLLDSVALYPQATFVPYNADFKPFVFHTFYNVSWAPAGSVVNNTWTWVVDPFWGAIYQVMGSITPNTGLANTGVSFVFPRNVRGTVNWGALTIVSAAVYYQTGILVIGLAAAGTTTGWISVHDLQDIGAGPIQQFPLPTNMSDPRAMVLDQFEGVVYIGLNGGGAVLRYNITSKASTTPLILTGQQNLPFYLHRVWTGVTTRDHIYFTTNEQVAKVFRLSKHDFCPSLCSNNQFYGAYCQRGQCMCQSPLTMVNGQCGWDNRAAAQLKKDHGGEVALGILFMITTILAAVFGFLWYRNRRHSYTAV